MDLTTIEQTELLARLVKAEARGEPLAGKLAVAHVVMNRQRDYRWPSTVQGVILQGRQFSCCDPSDPNYAIMLDRAPAWYVGLAELVLAGHTIDPSGGATHYHAEYVQPRWASHPRMMYLLQIGKHLFYYEKKA